LTKTNFAEKTFTNSKNPSKNIQFLSTTVSKYWNILGVFVASKKDKTPNLLELKGIDFRENKQKTRKLMPMKVNAL